LIQAGIKILLCRITAENLRHAHATLEAGRMIGKIVLKGF
jgi:hypothetical protein